MKNYRTVANLELNYLLKKIESFKTDFDSEEMFETLENKEKMLEWSKEDLENAKKSIENLINTVNQYINILNLNEKGGMKNGNSTNIKNQNANKIN